MQKWFTKDADIEHWMQPFTGAVVVPGGRRVPWTETRLFFDLYWKLLELGYTEEQISEYVIRKRWETTPPMPEQIAFVKAVYDLAEHKSLTPSPEFTPYLGRDHPRYIVDRFK